MISLIVVFVALFLGLIIFKIYNNNCFGKEEKDLTIDEKKDEINREIDFINGYIM